MNEILDMSDAFDDLTQTIQKVVEVVETIDFEKTTTKTTTNIEAVVQPANLEKLNVESIDYSKQYLEIHSVSPLEIGDNIIWNSTEFNIVQLGDYNNYGFYNVIAEEIK